MDTIKLFCLPYAGGSASYFYKWRWPKHKPYNIDVHPVELAGRGLRIKEPFYRDADEAIDDIMKRIVPEIYRGPYAIFGHSMGALLAFGLMQRMKKAGLKEPEHLFFSGKGDPLSIRKKEKYYHLLQENEFKQKLVELGGTPPEFFERPELMDFFIPLIRNDFRLACSHLHLQEIIPFNCDMTVLLGKDDDISAQEVHGWRKYTRGRCNIQYFNGGHFFLNQHTAEVLQLIEHTLKQSTFQRFV